MKNVQVLSSNVTKETAAEYRKISRMIMKSYEKDIKDYSVEAFVDWFYKEYGNKAYATLRKYIASLVFFANEKNPSLALDLGTQLKAVKIRKSESAMPAKKNRKKRKSYTESDFNRLLEYIDKRASFERLEPWWKHLALTLRANNLAGLRPCEWEHAVCVVDDGEIHLIVENAKRTHGRSHGKNRTLRFPLEKSIFDCLSSKIRLTKEVVSGVSGITIKNYNKKLATYLLRANNKVFGPNKSTIALYSTRHQLCASLKKSGASKAQVAAIFGHGSTETASRSYAKARYGRGGGHQPKAANDDVERVMKLNPAKEPPAVGETESPTDPKPPSPGPKMGM